MARGFGLRPEVLEATKLDGNVLASIVSKLGVTLSTMEFPSGKNRDAEYTMFDIGVLQFPPLDNPLL